MDLKAELEKILGAKPKPPLAEPIDSLPFADFSPEQIQVDLAIELKRRTAKKCRESLAEFFRASWPVLEPGTDLDWNWHLEVICDHIQALIEDQTAKMADKDFEMRAQNLIINVPPGTAKSRLLMVAAPAWVWIRWPGRRILCLSGNPANVSRDSIYCRALIESDWYQQTFQPRWIFRDDTNAVNKYANSEGGERISLGIKAKVTGQRGDMIFIDDPNEVKEALSEAIRTKINSDWDSTIYNRVNDLRCAIRIAIQQRVHEDDFTGHVLEGDGWAHLCLPLEYEGSPVCQCADCSAPTNRFGFRDPRSEVGENLHANRFPPKVVADLKAVLGSYGAAGQLQQRPASSEGGMFKWADWRFWKPDGTAAESNKRPELCYTGPARSLPSSFDEIVLSADCAFRKTATSDRVAIFVIGRIGADRFILDRRCARFDFGETRTHIRELVKIWPRIGAKLIEGKANGDAIVADLTREIPGMIAVDPEGGKDARAAVLAPSVEAGNWYLPDGAPWLEDFCHEFAVFPNGKHDDQVDAVSQAAIRFQLTPKAARAAMLGTL